LAHRQSSALKVVPRLLHCENLPHGKWLCWRQEASTLPVGHGKFGASFWAEMRCLAGETRCGCGHLRLRARLLLMLFPPAFEERK
jgi:hypothetical protein